MTLYGSNETTWLNLKKLLLMATYVPNKGHNRLALITGAGAGIGIAIAAKLLADGWRVVGWDRSASGLSDAAYVHTQLDLTDETAVARELAKLPDVDAFVHAAGVLRVGELGALDLSAGEQLWRIHVQAATQIANTLVSEMKTRGFGRMVFIGSRVASGMAGRGQYAAVKAALVALARSWAAELAPRGITLNVISPAATQTAMLQDPARAVAAPKVPPLGRYIGPTEVADLAAYMLSDAASAMTGQDVQLCGGASLKG
jgi:3-oxoacyl-[acyl-carrier protein] reductase